MMLLTQIYGFIVLSLKDKRLVEKKVVYVQIYYYQRES